MPTNEQVIRHTQQWIEQVVIGCNFCPFAARELKRGGVHYAIIDNGDVAQCLEAVVEECIRLDQNPDIGTTLLIFPAHFVRFADFLDLLALAEDLLVMQEYEGVYQIANFHPFYRFEGSAPTDPANYTNRSPYPTLHLLREESIDQVLAFYPDPEGIPERNIAYAQEKGLAHMKALLQACIV